MHEYCSALASESERQKRPAEDKIKIQKKGPAFDSQPQSSPLERFSFELSHARRQQISNKRHANRLSSAYAIIPIK